MTKPKAKYIFILPNIWLVPFIPLTLVFNIIDGLRGGFAFLPAPKPAPTKAGTLYCIIYIALCIAADIYIIKKRVRYLK